MILVYLNFIRSIPALLIYHAMNNKFAIHKDLESIGQPATPMGLHCALYYNSCCFRNIFYARTNNFFPMLTKLSKLLWHPMLDCGIEVTDGFGGGMKIFHGHSTIIYAKYIGNNFTTYQNVTLGRGKKINGTDIPVVGDDVTVYTGAIIVGGVHIGNRVKIGAGAVVVKDVPDDTTVVSSPVRHLKKQKVE